MPHDVFISYSSKDKNAADAVCAVLERNGIRCWIAPRDVLPGMPWGSAIVAAINDVKVFVLVFSGAANTSPQIEREVERAISKSIPVIPFRIEDVRPSHSLEYFISASHWLDAFTQPMEQHLETLAKVTRHIIELKDGIGGGETKPVDRQAASVAVPPPVAVPPAISAPGGSMRGILIGAGGALAACAALAAIYFVLLPQGKSPTQVSIAQAPPNPPANPPVVAQPDASPPAALPPAAPPPVPQAVQPPPAQPLAVVPPPAVQPPAVAPPPSKPVALEKASLSGRWTWAANCSGALWHGKFDLAETASDRFNGNFAGTEWHDIGKISDGHVDGASVSFTRTTAAYVQHWNGQLTPAHMEGSLSSDNYVCSWQANKD